MEMRQDGKLDRTKPIIIVAGGQWGSEAKGAVSAYLCQRHNVDFAVRTGAVNAGHTVYHEGTAFKMQQIPTGWVNPTTKLVIGPGALINREILDHEAMSTEYAGLPVKPRMYIDPRAGVHGWKHQEVSKASGRHHAIGATGKGCSEALIDRIRLRGRQNVLFGTQDGYMAADTEKMLNSAYDGGARILLEGTQGQGLDLLLGPWPYTTHKPCGPGQWMVENGLSPALKTEVVMVCRTYPIRVAGNSGPMPGEITWERLAWQINNQLARQNRGALVDPAALAEFNEACNVVGAEWGWDKVGQKAKLPRWLDTGQPNFRFDLWSAQMRERWAEGVSEFHKEVFSRLGEETVAELGKLFEFTTVTRKLRRIAEWDEEFMAAMVRQVRPSYVVLTFLNYEFPELWGATETRDLSEAAVRYIHKRERELGVEVRYVSTGPESQHILEVSL